MQVQGIREQKRLLVKEERRGEDVVGKETDVSSRSASSRSSV